MSSAKSPYKSAGISSRARPARVNDPSPSGYSWTPNRGFGHKWAALKTNQRMAGTTICMNCKKPRFIVDGLQCGDKK